MRLLMWRLLAVSLTVAPRGLPESDKSGGISEELETCRHRGCVTQLIPIRREENPWQEERHAVRPLSGFMSNAALLHHTVKVTVSALRVV